MILYLDTSAFVPLLIAEPTSQTCGALWDAADRLATTRLTQVEAAAALAMAERLGRITSDEHDAAREQLTALWPEFDIVELDEQLMTSAARAAMTHGLRGYDSVHFAAAVTVDDEHLVAAAGDERLLEAWLADGIAVVDTKRSHPSHGPTNALDGNAMIVSALESLAGARHTHLDAAQLVQKAPGLYAFFGDDRAWTELGLSPAFDEQPLYVGKAERSLQGRDVGTHFAAGKTGSSTVRRSLAALLVDELALVAVPRNLEKPDGSANFGLDPVSEGSLSSWMEQRLTLATWSKPEGASLDEMETAVVRRLHPPLNLDKVGEPRRRLREARQRMASTARAWRPEA